MTVDVALAWGVLLGFLLPLALIDLRRRIIPNAWLLRLAFCTAVVLALRLALLRGISAVGAEVCSSAAGFLLAGGICWLAWRLSRGSRSAKMSGERLNYGLGGGDVKLLAICGALLGAQIALMLMALALLLALLYAFGKRLVCGSAPQSIALAPAILISATICVLLTI